jgi:hypothetical protein
LRFRIPTWARAERRRRRSSRARARTEQRNFPALRPNLAVVAEDTDTAHRTQLPSSYYETATDLLRYIHLGSSSATTADHIVIINTV